jgi:rhodanese-related sulfurtransferase
MKFSKKILYFSIFVFFSLLMIGLFYSYQYAMDSPYRISAEEAKNRIKNNKIDLLLDVRTNLERETLGFYPGSVHIQSADLEKRMPLEFPNKNLHILAYCNTGQRARMAVEKLHALGYKNALYIATMYTSIV